MSASADAVLNIMRGETVKYPVTATTSLYKGSMISKRGGYASALVDGYKFNGHVKSTVLNTVAEGYGAAGDLNVEVYTGKYTAEIALTGVNEYMVGAYVYAYDDNTYCLAPLRTPVGIVRRYVSSGVAEVEFDTNMGRETMGAGVVGIFEGFKKNNLGPACVIANNSGVAGSWVRTSVNGPGAVVLQTIAAIGASPYCNGVLITPDVAENDSESFQLSGAQFMFVDTHPIFFGTRIKVADVTNIDLIMGIGAVDTALLAAWSDNISFRVVDAAGTCFIITEKATTEASATATTLVNDTYVNLGFLWDGASAIYPYVNGTRGTVVATTYLPTSTVGCTPSIEFTAGAASEVGLYMSFLDAYQIL